MSHIGAKTFHVCPEEKPREIAMDSKWNRRKRKRYVFRWARVKSGMEGNLTWSCYMKMEKPESSFSSPGRPPRYLIFPHDHHRQQRLHPRVFIFRSDSSLFAKRGERKEISENLRKFPDLLWTPLLSLAPTRFQLLYCFLSRGTHKSGRFRHARWRETEE